MNENENNKKMSLESNDNDAVKTPCQEANEVSKQGKKSFGRKV